MTAFADRTVVTIAVSVRLLRLNQTLDLFSSLLFLILVVLQCFSHFNTLFFLPSSSLFSHL